MNTAIIYNAAYPATAMLSMRCLWSFGHFDGWGVVSAVNGCCPATLDAYQRKYRLRDSRMKTDLGNRYAAKKSCFYSHFEQWLACAEADKPRAVVEYDTVCQGDLVAYGVWGVTHLSMASISATKKYADRWPDDAATVARAAAGVHSMHGLTRQRRKRDMPGNTAYVITPRAAEALIADCRANGWKQNDNLMARPLIDLWYVAPSPIMYDESVDLHTSHYVVA